MSIFDLKETFAKEKEFSLNLPVNFRLETAWIAALVSCLTLTNNIDEKLWREYCKEYRISQENTNSSSIINDKTKSRHLVYFLEKKGIRRDMINMVSKLKIKKRLDVFETKELNIRLYSSLRSLLKCPIWKTYKSTNPKRCHRELFLEYLSRKRRQYVIGESDINFETDVIDNTQLNEIYKNIDQFSELLKPYKNIMLITQSKTSSILGGADVNCFNLSKYYKHIGHNVLFLHLFQQLTSDIKEDNIDNIDNIESDRLVILETSLLETLKKIAFKPDIILLKKELSYDLREVLQCPVVYLIPGLYRYNIDFTKSGDFYQNEAIRKSVICQIKKSDFAFCNSAHVRTILSRYFGLEVGLFYSSFIQYYRQNIPVDPNFENRRYLYGLIVSDFNRPVKNIPASIEYLKNKRNVILIGANSSQFEKVSPYFTCLDYVPNSEISKYYKQIKYIRQDSYSEGCSNVAIEGLFNGCIIERAL